MSTYYIDTSAANDGDGTAYTQAAAPGGVGAFNTPVAHLGSATDVFWVRRVSAAKVVVAINFNVATKYIGWPIAGDDYYATRPDGGAWAAWDGDAALYPTWEHQANVGGAVFIASAGAGQEFHRIYFKKSTAVPGTSTVLGISGGGALFKTIWGELTVVPGTNTASYIFTFTPGSLTQISCYNMVAFANVSKPTYFTRCYWIAHNSNSNIYMNNCTTNITGVTSIGLEHSASTGACTQQLYAENCNFTSTDYSFGIAGFAANVARLHFYNCIFKSTTSWAVSCGAVGCVASVVFDNCSVTGDAGLNLQGGSVATTDPISLGATFIHLKTFVQDVATAYPITIKSHVGSCYIENVTFKSGNTTDVYNTGAQLILRNATFLSTPEVIAGSSRNVYCLDYGGVKGAFKAWQNNLIISSDASYRTGGEAYSIKIAPQAAADIPDQILGRCGISGQETIYANVPAGTYTITIYGAHKNWGATVPTQKDLWFEGSYYAEAAGAVVTAFSTRDLTDTALTADTSTWNGDSSLTVFKLTKTITTGQASLVPIRIYLSKYVSTAYIYIDPKVTVA